MTGFGTCKCGHRIYDHSRHTKDGNYVWAGCRTVGCVCTIYRASDGSSWPNSHQGASPDDPTDLHVNTDHWVDGEVVLTDPPAAARSAA